MNGKEAYYFSHDSNARQDEKILALRMKHGWEGYGLYWALVEKLREASSYSLSRNYNIIAFDLRVDAAKIKSIIEDFGLFSFTDNGECFYSDSLIKRMAPKDEAKKQASVSGIIGNLIKWGHATREQLERMTPDQIIEFRDSVTALKSEDQTNSNRNSIGGRSGGDRVGIAKESKGEESKVKENIPPIPPKGGDVCDPVNNRIDSDHAEAEKGKRKKVAAKKEKELPPGIEEFTSYALEVVAGSGGSPAGWDYSIRAKYEQWMGAGWKDGYGKVIRNWKSKIRNTLPHMRPLPVPSSKISKVDQNIQTFSKFIQQ